MQMNSKKVKRVVEVGLVLESERPRSSKRSATKLVPVLDNERVTSAGNDCRNTIATQSVGGRALVGDHVNTI